MPTINKNLYFSIIVHKSVSLQVYPKRFKSEQRSMQQLNEHRRNLAQHNQNSLIY